MADGELVAIARTARPMAPMEEIAAAEITAEAGITGDARGRKRGRQVTVLFAEDWQAALGDLGEDLPWTTRRANLLVRGVANPRREGARLVLGDVVLEAVFETDPCAVMEKARAGLRAALAPGWRGGLCCRVISGGRIETGMAVRVAV